MEMIEDVLHKQHMWLCSCAVFRESCTIRGFCFEMGFEHKVFWLLYGYQKSKARVPSWICQLVL